MNGPGVGPDVKPSRNVNVLVVEDDDGLRETTVSILSEEGYDVNEAPDGSRALELLDAQDIDVLVLDLRLPRTDGRAVLEALIDPPTIVILSAFDYVDQDEIHDRFAPVVFDYLRKPVSPQRLIAVMAAAANRARLRWN